MAAQGANGLEHELSQLQQRISLLQAQADALKDSIDHPREHVVRHVCRTHPELLRRAPRLLHRDPVSTDGHRNATDRPAPHHRNGNVRLAPQLLTPHRNTPEHCVAPSRPLAADHFALQLQRLPRDTTVERVMAALNDDGAVIIERLVSGATVEAVKRELRPFVDATLVPSGGFAGGTTKRTGSVLARSESSWGLIGPWGPRNNNEQ